MKITPPLAIAILLALSCGPAPRIEPVAPQSPAEAETNVTPAIPAEPDPKERHERALIEQTGSPNETIRKRALATLGLFYKQEGRLREAGTTLEQAAGIYPELRPFLLVELLELTEAGEPARAVSIGEQILTESFGSAAAELVRLRLPALLARAGQEQRLPASMEQALSIPLDELNEPHLLRTANELAAAGKDEEAHRIRLRLLRDFTRGRTIETMYRQLVEDDNSPLHRLSFPQALDLAERLGRVNRHELALDLLDRIARRYPERAGEAQFQWIRASSWFGSRRYAEVVALPARPGQPYELALQRLRAHAHWRLGNHGEFLRLANALLERTPSSSEARTTRVLLAKYYLIDGKDARRAAQLLEQVIREGGSGSEGEHLWTLAWIHISGRDHARALATLERYLRAHPDSDYTTNALFWRGKLHEEQGELPARNEAFRRLIETYPYSYYSYRARAIVGLAVPPPPLVESGFRFPESGVSAEDPRLEIVRELEAIGMTEEATRQYRLIAGKRTDDPLLAYGLAARYARHGEPLEAIITMNRNFRDLIRHGAPNLPDSFWEVLYPLPHRESILRESEGRIDPWLVAAIIRQESGFNPSVVSSAGAVGLMQIMPNEAGSIAGRAGLAEEPSRADLFDPEVNIRLGVAELLQKLHAMNGNMVLAIAAYNAGEGNVGRWLANQPIGDIDRFIESIPFNETRLYVKNVIRNRYEYARIHGARSSISSEHSIFDSGS